MTADGASALIGLVYDGALESSQWKGLLDKIRKLCPGYVAAAVTFEDANWRASHEATLPDGAQGDRILEVMEAEKEGSGPQPTELNKLMFRRQPLELGTLYQTRELFSEEEFRNSETYKTTMAPVGAGQWTGVHYSISGDWRAALMLVENEFDKGEKDAQKVTELMRRIGPHAVRAARIVRALDMAKQAAETYSGFIDAVALPLLVLTADGRLQMTNTLGQRETEVCSEKTVRNQIHALHVTIGVKSTRELSDALAVFRMVGSMLED